METSDIQKNTKDSGIDLGRELKIGSMAATALDTSWFDTITGRRIDFPQPNGKMVWGIEMTIPLRFGKSVETCFTKTITQLAKDRGISLSQKEIDEQLANNGDQTWFHDIDKIDLPKSIKNIRIIDLSPQESLPKGLRNIDSQRTFWNDLVPSNRYLINRFAAHSSQKSLIDRAVLSLQLETRSTQVKSQALQDIFWDIFGANPLKIKLFQDVLAESKASEIVIIHAHGGYDNIIGEQGSRKNQGEVKGVDASYQAYGNRINVNEVLEYYDRPEQFAAILVDTCYKGLENPRRGKVKVFRAYGVSGGGHPSRNWNTSNNKTLTS